MKKYLLLFILVGSVTLTFSQVKIGLKVSPGVLFNRVLIDSDSLEAGDLKEKFIYPFGIFFDVPMSERYYISTGVNFLMKNPEFTLDFADGTNQSVRFKSQYLQVPVLLKLYTDEIIIDKRIYFQLGPAFEVMIHNDLPEEYLKKITFADITFHISAGWDMKVGPNTVLFTGVTYQRGLLNVIHEYGFDADRFVLKNDLIVLDLGLKL